MRLNSFEAELIRDWHSAMTHEKGQERSSLSSGLVMADDSDNAIVSLNSAFKEKKKFSIPLKVLLCVSSGCVSKIKTVHRSILETNKHRSVHHIPLYLAMLQKISPATSLSNNGSPSNSLPPFFNTYMVVHKDVH